MKTWTSVRSAGLMPFSLPIPFVADAFALQPVRAQAAFAVPTITSKPAHPMSGTSSTAFIAPGATFQCRLAAAAFATYTGSEGYAGTLAQGCRTFQAKALFGSKVRTSTSYSWTVATFVSPAPSPTAKPVSPSNTASPSFSCGGPESGVTSCWTIDGSAPAACASSHSHPSHGAHSFSVPWVDPAGNGRVWTAWSWSIPSLGPRAPGLTQKLPSATSTDTFGGTDAGAGACASFPRLSHSATAIS